MLQLLHESSCALAGFRRTGLFASSAAPTTKTNQVPVQAASETEATGG
jgi:hypothetical protein